MQQRSGEDKTYDLLAGVSSGGTFTDLADRQCNFTLV